jgi:Glycosyl transferase family 2
VSVPKDLTLKCWSLSTRVLSYDRTEVTTKSGEERVAANSTAPAISVIVIAHDRSEFLPAAIRSVLAQSLPAERVELIVVKGTADPTLDDSIRQRGGRVVLTTQMYIGAKLALGISQSNAPVIAFLEDDDVWAAGKLSHVRDVFAENDQLGFYHNRFVPWRTNDPLTDPPSGLGAERPARAGKPVYNRPSSLGPRLARWILAHGDLLNTSSIAVRREVVVPFLGDLSRISKSPELGLLFPSAISDSMLCFDPMALTAYRLHARAASAIPTGDLEEVLQEVCRRATRALPEFRDLGARLRFRGPRVLVRLLTFSLEVRSLVAGNRRDRRNALRLLASRASVLGALGTPDDWLAGDVLLLVEYLFSPKWARKELYQRSLQGIGTVGWGSEL